MKKILLLGGSTQQVIAIETAKRLGYYTVLCDYLTDNPGQYVADKFYLVSTTDKDAVLKVAKTEKVDGVLAYASDPAAPTAAFVAEQLELPGNPYKSVCTLCDKGKFREFLKNNGFNTPYANDYSSLKDVMKDKEKYTLPIIIKPVDSSGSKGATVVESWDNAPKAFDFALSFSRVKRIVIEEFVIKKHPYLIGGDIFVSGGKIILWGLMNCHRDITVNPLVPVGKSFPPLINGSDFEKIKIALQRLVDKLHYYSGAMNVELIIDKNDKEFFIDVGPRNGGNMIPDLLGYIFDVDVVEMTIRASMGERIEVNCLIPNDYYATHNLHTSVNGKFSGIEFDPVIEKHIIKNCIYKNSGDDVEYFDNASKALGIVFFKFESLHQMNTILGDINRYITVKVN